MPSALEGEEGFTAEEASKRFLKENSGGLAWGVPATCGGFQVLNAFPTLLALSSLMLG